MRAKILYVDDDDANLSTFRRAFRFDYEVHTAESGEEGLKRLRELSEIALIVADQRMPKMKGTAFLEQALQIHPHAQRIMLTAFTDVQDLLDAIQKGHVYDYVVKPWKPEELKRVMDRAIAIFSERIERIKQLMAARASEESYREMTRRDADLRFIIGAEGALATVLEQARKVALTQANVLIRGETGTGKELIARAIHRMSPRAEKPLIVLNCAAFAPGLLESELFGHEKGAFTGAQSAKRGRFELAEGGTLFLDEIGDLPEGVQVKLLRFLQEKEIERVGGLTTRKLDVRLIAATHQPLERRIQEGRFREDLFYRLNVVPITLPPLRKRGQDLSLLIDHFFTVCCAENGKSLTLGKDAKEYLLRYDWPGNVRELRNVLERAVILGEGELSADDLLLDLSAANESLSPLKEIDPRSAPEKVLAVIHDERAQELAEAIRKAGGNISETARLLDIPRSTLVYRLRKYGIA